MHGCQTRGQDQHEEFKKIEKLPKKKAIRIINFFPLSVTVENQMYEMNIPKLKDLIKLQNQGRRSGQNPQQRPLSP